MSESKRARLINELHAEYVRLTGFRISVMGREWAWFEWIKRELGVAELRMLVAEKRRRIRAGELTGASLAFRNLIGNADFAEEDVAELRSRARGANRVPQDKQSLLKQTGRPAPTHKDSTTRSAGDVINQLESDPAAAAKALEELRQFKNNL